MSGEAGRTLWTLTIGLTLAMTSLGVLAPVIPRRLDELGAGVTTLSLMAGSYATAQLLAAPLMGRLGDRTGRRPVIVVALLSYVIAAVVFAVVDAAGAFVAVNGLEGALAAGLFPAATAAVADLTGDAGDSVRTKWIGVVTASYAVGFLVGPLLGGVLADAFDTTVAATTAAVVAVVALAATLTVSETKPDQPPDGPAPTTAAGASRSVVGLLTVDLLVMAAFGFAAPQLVFFAYDEAGLTTTQYGIVIAASALAMAVGQTWLAGPADRIGRPTVVVVGLALYAATFAAYIPFHSPVQITLIAAVAGLAYGIVGPAITATYLDRTPANRQASVLGTRTATMAAGGIVGSAVLAVLNRWITPELVFTATAVGLAAAAVAAVPAVRAPATARTPLGSCGPLLALVTTNKARYQHTHGPGEAPTPETAPSAAVRSLSR